MAISLLGSNDGAANEEAFFRSAPMTLVQFYVTIELARDVVYALGNLGDVHFRDLNSKLTPFQRTFIAELRQNDVVEARLTYLQGVMMKHEIWTGDPFAKLTADRAPFPKASDVDSLRSRILEVYERIKHLDESFVELDQRYLKYVENRHVVQALEDFHKNAWSESEVRASMDRPSIDGDDVALLNARNRSLELGSFEIDDEDRDELTPETADLDISFDAISGTIATEKIGLLRKILWRTLRGNLYFHDIPITSTKLSNFNPKTPELIDKSVFILFVHGDMLRLRVNRIILSLDGIVYDNVNGSAADRSRTFASLNLSITDLATVVDNTRNHLMTELSVLKEAYPNWWFIIQREKLIYQVLNTFDNDAARRCLVGEGWIPKSDLNTVRTTLKQLIRKRSAPRTFANEPELLDHESTSTPSSPGRSSSVDLLFAIEDDHEAEDAQFESDDEDALIAVVTELSTNRTPPTFHRTNKFTSAFQLIIDAYGIATYQEVNPGLATIITFPFMFAIMFGDIGHGFIVLLVALYLIKNENIFGPMRNKDEIFEMAFNGRYIILLMGAFSMYTGLIYNDIFSKSMTLFKSGWKWEFPKDYDFSKDGPISLVAQKIPGHTYFFGLDWAWHGSENNLLFTNSLKMKLSILMGYIHMNYSLMFSLVNYRYFKSRVDIVGNFIPGFLFMQSIFGYLALTILYKWSVDWFGIQKQPPGLLNMLINMFLSPGYIEDQLYPGQKFVQIVLVLVALVCVPWLLVYKPLTLRRQNNRAIELGYSDLHSQHNHDIQRHVEEQALDESGIDDGLNHDAPDEIDMLDDGFRFPNDIEPLHHTAAHGDGDEFNFGDVVIHQVIHTIEFCLNCVSHTASYLRLWALSLAHAQLSSVLWSMTIQNAFGITGAKGVVMTVFLFGLWFILTVCILVMMEGTSAMLHSLRLHWVEAMSKFFEGEGYAYEPFTFNKIDV